MSYKLWELTLIDIQINLLIFFLIAYIAKTHHRIISAKMRKSVKLNNKQIQPKLPPIQNSLTYQNQYQNYEEDLFQYKSKNTIKQNQNNEWNQYQSQSQLYNSGLMSKSSHNQNQTKSIKIQTSNQKLQNDAFNNLTKREQEQYNLKTADQLKQELKQMRLQFQEMNTTLNQRLNVYNLSKSQQKQFCQQSQPQFYEVQIATNKRIEQAQILQLKKLSKIQSQVKDKDILLQLQQLVFEYQNQIHMKKKQQHQNKVKNHKLDRKLDQQLTTNQFTEESNYVKIIKLQIVYYLKKLNDLRFHEEQLDHSKKLLLQNDQTLSKKFNQVNKIVLQNNLEVKFNKSYLEMKKKYHQLMQQVTTLKKRIQTTRRSNDIFQQKSARTALQHKNQIIKVINPEIERLDIQNQDMNIKVRAVMERYGIIDSQLQEVKYRFSDDITFHSRYAKQDKGKLLKVSLKPNFRINSRFSAYKSIENQGMNTSRTARKLFEMQEKDKTQSDARLVNYNDKNISINLQENDQQNSNHKFKPKINMKNISKTIETYKPNTFSTQVSPILLKPRMHLSKR